MKKLTTLALGLGLALGSVAFAQDSTGTMAPADGKTTTTKKAKKAKKSKKPATDSSTPSTDKSKM